MSEGQACVYQTPFGESLPYQFFQSSEVKEAVPIILFLHGAGQRGNDNYEQKCHGFNDIVKYSQENNKPCYILAPQCPLEMQWVNTDWTKESHRIPEFPSLPLKLALELLQQKINELNVDRQRVYICGLSMGGYGTWDAITRKPDLFAAALPVCGGGDVTKAVEITHIPLWTVHGDVDDVVPVSRSRDMVSALQEAGGSPTYTEHKGAGHDVWSRTFKDNNMLNWLFLQKKK